MTGYWITMSNSAGPLERRFAPDQKTAQAILVDLVCNLGSVEDGDTFTVAEGESDER